MVGQGAAGNEGDAAGGRVAGPAAPGAAQPPRPGPLHLPGGLPEPAHQDHARQPHADRYVTGLGLGGGGDKGIGGGMEEDWR